MGTSRQQKEKSHEKEGGQKIIDVEMWTAWKKPSSKKGQKNAGHHKKKGEDKGRRAEHLGSVGIAIYGHSFEKEINHLHCWGGKKKGRKKSFHGGISRKRMGLVRKRSPKRKGSRKKQTFKEKKTRKRGTQRKQKPHGEETSDVEGGKKGCSVQAIFERKSTPTQKKREWSKKKGRCPRRGRFLGKCPARTCWFGKGEKVLFRRRDV